MRSHSTDRTEFDEQVYGDFEFHDFFRNLSLPLIRHVFFGPKVK